VNSRVSLEIKPRRLGSRVLRAAYYLFLAAGTAGLAYASYAVVDAHAYQAIEESRLSTMRPAQVPRAVANGDVIGEMMIPRLELKTIVAQGESPKILRRAVGHVPGTAMPGQPGNVALAGHRDSFFRSLRGIQLGDAISIKTPDGEFEYQVESIAVVMPTDVQVLQPSPGNVLTLVTCFPFYYVGAAPKRFIVRARQIHPLPTRSPAADAPLPY
jgi:sortase A